MLTWNNTLKQIEGGDTCLKLTRQETRLVDLLANAPRAVVPHDKIAATFQGKAASTISKMSSRIRQKVSDTFGEGNLSIHVISHIGMCWAGGISGAPPSAPDPEPTGKRIILCTLRRAA